MEISALRTRVLVVHTTLSHFSRKGFIIALEQLQNLKSTKFRCSYRQHISQQFTYAGSPRNERPMISTKDWSVVEDKVTVECIIQVDDPSQYIFEWLSPEEVCYTGCK